MMTLAGRRALDPSLDGSQHLPVTSDGCIDSGQPFSQARLSQQVSLDLQDQPLERGDAIGFGHEGRMLHALLLVALGRVNDQCQGGIERVRFKPSESRAGTDGQGI